MAFGLLTYFGKLRTGNINSFQPKQATLDALIDLRQENFLNKSRVLLTEDVDRSLLFILYAEDIGVEHLMKSEDVNSALKLSGLPYEIVFSETADSYMIRESDLLLTTTSDILHYPQESVDRLKLLREWNGGLVAYELDDQNDCPGCDDDIIW